jgi:hypothetical protein
MIQMDWETGKHRPGPRYRLLLSAVYDADECEIFADKANPRWPEHGIAGQVAHGAVADVPARGDERPGLVAPELVGYFRDQLAGHYSADRFLGPMSLIPITVPQYNLLCDLADSAKDDLRTMFWGLAAGYAAFVGWLFQDAGDLKTSGRWLDVMLEQAHRSQDAQLIAFALHNKAMLQADIRDGRGTLDLARAAMQGRECLCPKVQVLVLQQAAHGTSLVGGDDASKSCDRLLDEASGLVELIEDDYPWGTACKSPFYLDVQRATVWTRLGRTRQALGLWDRIIPGIPISDGRDLGVFRARQAQALAAAAEPERAVAVAREVVPTAVRTGSARIRAELRVLREHLEPWSGEAIGREFDELWRESLKPKPLKGSHGTEG